MVSQLQKDQINRQNHLAAVQSESIQLSGLSLTPDSSLQYWGNISFNLMNLNIHDASVVGIAISKSNADKKYVDHFNTSSLSSSLTGNCTNFAIMGNGTCYGFSDPMKLPTLTIPAGSGMSITMNLTDNNIQIGTSDQVDILILTSLGNTFEQTYRLPTPVIVYNTETIALGSVQRDNIVLDGSQSSSGNATIVNWNWTLTNAVAGSCSGSGSMITGSPASGRIVRISPTTTGPFCANLTVKDSNGMVATSPYQFIPQDLQFVPAASIQLVQVPSGTIINGTTTDSAYYNVTVYDANSQAYKNQPVSYVINQFSDSSPFKITPFYPSSSPIQTDAYGNLTIKMCGNGTATFSSGKLSTNSMTFVNHGC